MNMDESESDTMDCYKVPGEGFEKPDEGTGCPGEGYG